MKLIHGQLALSVLAALMAALAAPAAAQTCTLEYQRADNMMAATGRPDGPLGKETLTLQPGQNKVFVTDWKYEKQRNDGNNYYGSHVRIVSNPGSRPVELVLRGDLKALINAVRSAITQRGTDTGVLTLAPGQSLNIKNDLMEVSCPVGAAKAAGAGTVPQASMQAPRGLMAKQLTANEIMLSWEKLPGVREYRVYVSPPPSPNLAGRPGVVGGNGDHYVIFVPPSVPAMTVYGGAIEAVGTNGAVSARVPFPSVNLVRPWPPGAPAGGGQPATGATGATAPAGQMCPPGQFVTGFSGNGTIVCAPPR